MRKSIFIVIILLVRSNSFSQTKNNEAFDTFFTQFKKSKSFQIERILFPVKVIHNEFSTESGKTEIFFISKVKWDFSDFSTSMNKKLFITQKSIPPNNHNVIFQIEDTGVYVQYLFKNQNGKWFLYEIRDDST